MAGRDVGNEDLIRHATKGDAQAVERLLRRYQPLMRHVVLEAAAPQLLRYAEADEIVQHAMMTCFRNIARLAFDEQPQRQFEAWLAKVVRTAVRYFGRKRRRALLELSSDARDAVPDKGPTASRLQRRKERSQRLNAAISTLPDDTQKMFELRLKGLSLSEIAAALGMKRALVNARIERALERLKKVLGTTSLNLSSE
ncbi:ECF RNA polymerase sigma factor SigE [Phycisphaerae bacterium RAS1]|nr:ECF RNA polymerase sigma factor SigE [Phycisphaerae bacterium RAS1]